MYLSSSNEKDKVYLLMSSNPTNPAPLSTARLVKHEPEAVPLGSLRIPELLAPAGNWECAKAAVENGADAIYFGLEKFNARMRAQNFTESDLPRLMEFLHGRGVKGYVTFNTLIFENELMEAEQYARAIIATGVDAAIVQDVGICRLIRQLSPDFPIHVSTQMTVTSAAGVEFARDLGCNLVVLARECSLKEIEKIVSGTSPLAASNPTVLSTRPTLPLEVFVHGALCVAYSGQCLTSEALGGRSANRGECAQACRMPYDLISDGKPVPLGNRKYLLSPQDLAGLEVLSELLRLGVASLKIEGRLKSPEYVANITRIYRNALDKLGAESAAPTRVSGAAPRPNGRTTRYEMEMAFSRGLYAGWFRGINNQELVHGCFGKKRGVYLGEVSEVLRDGVRVKLEQSVEPGDGVVFDAGHPEEQEAGGRVYEVLPGANPDRARPNGSGQDASKGVTSEIVLLRFGHGDIDFSRIHSGDRLWKTSDPKLERDLRQTYQGDRPKFRRPISIEVHGQVGRALTLLMRDDIGHVVRCESAMPLTKAETQPLTTQRLIDQLGRLGGTPFVLGPFKNLLAGDVLLPISELNRLRREAVRQLEAQRATPPRWVLRSPTQATNATQETAVRNRTAFGVPPSGGQPADLETMAKRGGVPPKGVTPNHSEVNHAQLIVLVRNLSQLDAALNHGVQLLYCDFEDPKKYGEAVSRFRSFFSATPQAQIFVAPPRIFKMGEEWTLRQVRSSEADGYLVRNYDHLSFFANDRCIGDYSLNVANHLTADYFRNKFGLERITASYDLNFNQLEALLRAAPPNWFEVTLHQHMPMFHMEHCLFCAFLSSGTDYTNCGRPCDKHELRLRDRVGAEHPVKADSGCRNTVFNARAQTGAEYAARMLELGVRHFRIEFVNENAEAVGRTITKYRQLLRGEMSGAQLWRELKLINQLGVTRGQIAGTS
jgi:putative protease